MGDGFFLIDHAQHYESQYPSSQTQREFVKPMCRSYDTVEVVRLDDRNYKFLYAEGKCALCIT